MVWDRFLMLPADTKSKVTRREEHVIVEKLPARPLKHRAKAVHLLAPVCPKPSWTNTCCLLQRLWLFCQLYNFFLPPVLAEKFCANSTNWSFCEIPFLCRVSTDHSSTDASSTLKILTCFEAVILLNINAVNTKISVRSDWLNKRHCNSMGGAVA